MNGVTAGLDGAWSHKENDDATICRSDRAVKTQRTP